ncbi:jg14860 [Pararge aegeria aegeria]|uniref:Ubiquitin conjugation factor E4 A n=1 Tax=Pararge aegeria aegeria TaxID=348720 RepID=A0A8S4R3K2_9NEOP|nr:jg14860 [Pararge aegeria aegeria]
MSDPSNPFAGLLGVSGTGLRNTNGAECNSSPVSLDCKQSQEEARIQTINKLVENVFHFTINSSAVDGQTDEQLVYLEELAQAMNPKVYIDLETLEQALFERLLLQDIENNVIPKTNKALKEHITQKQVFPYLFGSMENVQSFSQTNNQYIRDALEKMKELILRNAVTALKQPALFEGQEFSLQLVEILQSGGPQSHTFFSELVEAFIADETEDCQNQLRISMIPVLKRIQFDIDKSNLINLPIYILPSIQLFAGNPHLAWILLETCEPKNETNGRLYQESVIGALLSLSVLPQNTTAMHDFFDNPMDQAATSMIETSIWNASSHLTNNLHKIFLTLLKGGPTIKNRLLSWIGKCLKNNAARGKLWNVQAGVMSVATLRCVSDGFMLNLGAVLLQLCQPFCTMANDPKSLKIDPTYGAVLPEECAAKSVHLDCLHTETCLLPARESEDGQTMKRPTADTYSFVTECFFMTQKCIDLGVRVCAEKLWRCGQDLGRAQRAIADAASAHHMIEPMRQQAQFLMTKFVSFRCALLENEMLTNLHRLQAMTCTWLAQVAARPNPEVPQSSYAPLTVMPMQMPITTPPPDTLRCIPEFVLENIVVLITMARRTVGAITEEADIAGLLEPALTLVLTFMGDSSRTYNPHLRARLAECLEAMLPNHPDDQQPLSNIASFYREQLFKNHPHRLQLLPCLLDVFVGIEMTGQSVQFEQKFNYRRPMYLVMDFLWGIEEHRDAFTLLAREAESNMDAVHPPIFLRFVNLLMNDAIFLLDEALGNMAQIRTMQTAQYVKDLKEYEFDPAKTVMDICQMYVELGNNQRFCAAVSDDGRSYSPQLFTLAEAVLVRIGGGGLITSLQEVAARVGTLAVQRQRDEEILANAPEEFLDPIMSTLMMDPVILPSSRTTVDRITIARHLLSDQTDPFNRSPLSMDQVKSNTELKDRIQAWISEQRQKNDPNNVNTS